MASPIQFAIIQDDLNRETEQYNADQGDKQGIGGIIILLNMCGNLWAGYCRFCVDTLPGFNRWYALFNDGEARSNMKAKGTGPGAADGLAGSSFPHTYMPVVCVAGLG